MQYVAGGGSCGIQRNEVRDSKMKIKAGFVIRRVAGKYIVVATGKASREFHGMVRFDETGKTI